MLRVRPIIFASRFNSTAAQLRELGLTSLENDGDWAEFDSGNGKVGVVRGSPDRPTIVLAFELRDPAIFVRRTLADGTRAELTDTANGAGARVTAPGGFSFELSASADVSVPAPAVRSAVTAIWRTPDPAAANKVLADIGARKVQNLPDGGALFRAKNGGFVATAQGAVSGVDLEIKYDGGTFTLAGGEA
jgi:hypothetical protein